MESQFNIHEDCEALHVVKYSHFLEIYALANNEICSEKGFRLQIHLPLKNRDQTDEVTSQREVMLFSTCSM